VTVPHTIPFLQQYLARSHFTLPVTFAMLALQASALAHLEITP
jgi:hypothetical protein